MAETNHQRTRVVGQVYSWDLADGPARAPILRDAGLDAVAIAATYHSVRTIRWADDLSPVVVVEPRSASYLPPDGGAWGVLRPGSPVTSRPGIFGEAALSATRAGLSVIAWLVLAHDDEALAVEHPSLATVDAWGTRSRTGLCATQPEFARYARSLVESTVRTTGVTAFLVESLSSPGVVHSHAHDKVTLAGLGPLDAMLLSICCCSACADALARRGGDSDELAHRIRASRGLTVLDSAAARAISEALESRDATTAQRATELSAPVDGAQIDLTVAATSNLDTFGAFAPVSTGAIEGRSLCADLATPDGWADLERWDSGGAHHVAGVLPVAGTRGTLAQRMPADLRVAPDDLYLYHLGMRRPDTIAELGIHEGE